MPRRVLVVLLLTVGAILINTQKAIQPVAGAQRLAAPYPAAEAGPRITNWNINPWAIPADNLTQMVITATVSGTPGAIGPVTINLSALGKSAVTPLYDDGVHNDGVASDNVFGLITTAALGAQADEVPLTLTVSDRSGNTFPQYVGTFTVLSPLTSTWPLNLPAFMGWGTFDGSWLSNSGLPWNYQAQYVTSGWQAWGPTYVRDAAQSAWSHGYVPVFSLYLLLNVADCGTRSEEDCDFAHLQDSTAMQSFFSQATAAAQQANGSQPVIFHIEPDGTAYMQRYTLDHNGQNGIVADNPDTLPAQSLSPSYPNTYSGVIHRLIDIIHQRAPNALVSLHARSWATGTDVAASTIADLPIDSFAQRTAAFLTTAGGPQLDLVFSDWKTNDAGSGVSPWWDNTNLVLPNFSRMIHWQNRLAYYSGRRMILWKVPAGNMNLPNVCNAYQDNRVDYAFTHSRDLQDAGFIAVIVGGGDHCRTTPATDGGNVQSKAAVYYASPLAPLGLTAVPIGNQVKVSWLPGSNFDLWGYRVYYGRNVSSMNLLVDAHRQTSVGATLPSSGRWYLVVTAYDARGIEGLPSAPVMVNLP